MKKGKKRSRIKSKLDGHRKKLKKHAKTIKRKAKTQATDMLYRVFFKSCYLIGLSFLIPFAITYALPSESGEIWYSLPLLFFFVSLLLVLLSFYGLFWKHKHLGKTFKSIGFMSLVPGLLAAFVSTIGKQKLVSAVLSLHAGETTARILGVYIDRTTPKLKVLVFSYIVIGLFFYWIGTKLKE